MRTDAVIANAGWLAASIPEWARYRYAAANVEKTQRDLLQRYLRQNARTAFGKENHFARIHSWEEYAERVPPRAYDEFHPWIERIAAGAPGILTAERVDLLEPSSGSSGPEKWVPYTRTLQTEFRRAVAVWITQNFMDSPRLMGGPAYWSLTPQAGRKRSGMTRIPIGFDEDSAYLGGVTQRLIDLTLVTRPALRHIMDMETFWHATLLLLLKCKDLRLMSVWHPSYITLLLRHMRSDWPTLLRNLRTGLTLDSPRLHFDPDPQRARELDTLSPEVPGRIWPELRLISCWGDAHAARCADDLRTVFPAVRLQPKGLVATEAFVTLPLAEFRPLAIRSHFFEFLDDAGDVHPAWDLNCERPYKLVVTTGGGLYRYLLQDRVEVTGYYRDAPSLLFLGKEDNVSDFYGEKLSESFVASVLGAVFDRHDLAPQFAMIALDDSGATPAYSLYVQCQGGIPGDLEEALESELRQNPHYDLCVRLGQLGHVGVTQVASHAYEVYSQRLTDCGVRLGNIKPAPLSRLAGWPKYFSATAVS
jgi:hypothetical protein